MLTEGKEKGQHFDNSNAPSCPIDPPAPQPQIKEYILCAALYFYEEKVYVHQPKNIKSGFVVCGRRHHNCFITLRMIKEEYVAMYISEGFITNTDRFVSREEAYKIAFEAGQIKDKEISNTPYLVSEDLY